MKLLVTKEEAIKILRIRINQLMQQPFNYKVWQNATEIDVKTIFGTTSDQSFQVSHINFYTPVPTYQDSILRETKEHAKGLLEAYIDQIESYSKIQEQDDQKEKNQLVKQYSGLISQYGQLEKKLAGLKQVEISLRTDNANLRDQVNEKDTKIKTLIDNTLQLDKVTLNALWATVRRTPIKQIWPVIAALMALLIIAFWIGVFFQKHFLS